MDTERTLANIESMRRRQATQRAQRLALGAAAPRADVRWGLDDLSVQLPPAALADGCPVPVQEGVHYAQWDAYLARPNNVYKLASAVVYVALPPLPHVPWPEQYYSFLAWLQRHEMHAEVGGRRPGRLGAWELGLPPRRAFGPTARLLGRARGCRCAVASWRGRTARVWGQEPGAQTTPPIGPSSRPLNAGQPPKGPAAAARPRGGHRGARVRRAAGGAAAAAAAVGGAWCGRAAAGAAAPHTAGF